MTDLSAEYYRLLTPGGFFSSRVPAFSASRSNLGQSEARGRALSAESRAGIEAGRTFDNPCRSPPSGALKILVGASHRFRWRTYLTGTSQTGLLHIDIDKETSGAVSPQGFRLSASAGALYHAVASSNAPFAMLSSARTWQWKENNIFGLTADINSYLRANVAQPYRFTLGGPRRLSASSFDEYRGTDTYLARAGYLRRIAALPTGYGQGIYGIIGYEAGEVWSLKRKPSSVKMEPPELLRQPHSAPSPLEFPSATLAIAKSSSR